MTAVWHLPAVHLHSSDSADTSCSE